MGTTANRIYFFGGNRNVYKWMPVITDECNGCGLCVEACGPKSLLLQDGVAVLAVPETCGSEEHCIGLCTVDAIRMEWLPFKGDVGRGEWRSELPRN